MPTELFHYTSANGLKAILEEKEIWATDLRYMNNYRELKYARQLKESVMKTLESECLDEDFRSVLRRTREATDPYDDGFMVFACCFCEKRDALSQWRGYGADVVFHALQDSRFTDFSTHGLEVRGFTG